MVSLVSSNPSCQHTQTFRTHDGKTKCSDCEQIMGKTRLCPECLSPPHGMSDTKYYCASCKSWFFQTQEHECPICHKSERIKHKYDRIIATTTSAVLYCHACKCEFSRHVSGTIPNPSSIGGAPSSSTIATPRDPPRPPPPFTRGNNSTTGTTSIYAAKSVEGLCPKCRNKVKSYSKRGAWCQTCSGYVYPVTKHPTRYIFEGSV